MGTKARKIYRPHEFRSGIKFKPQSTEPTTAAEGDIYFHTSYGIGQYIGGAWDYGKSALKSIAVATGLAGILSVSTVAGVATLSISEATTSQAGLMSAADKATLVSLDSSISAATAENTASTIVKRDAEGAFKVSLPANPSTDNVANVGYVDDRIAGLEAMVDGSLKQPEAYNPSSGNYPSTYKTQSVQAGDSFRITAAGQMGSRTVNSEDLLIALVDAPNGDGDWMVAESNRDQASDTVKGVVALATQAEAEAKSNTVKAVVPADLINFPTEKTVTWVGDSVATEKTFTHNLGKKTFVYDAIETTGGVTTEIDVTVERVSDTEAKIVLDEVLPTGTTITLTIQSK